jgi:hypothetical protein
MWGRELLLEPVLGADQNPDGKVNLVDFSIMCIAGEGKNEKPKAKNQKSKI